MKTLMMSWGWCMSLALLPVPGAAAQLERAGFEDHAVPAGTLENGILHVELEAREAAWYPWGAEGPAVLAHVFAVDGESPRVPAPLLRVPVGTEVRLVLRNTFSRPLVVRGLRRGTAPRPERDAAPTRPDSVAVGPGMTEEIRFTPTTPGTYAYTGQVGPATGGEPRPDIAGGGEANRTWFGVLIVDPADEPRPEERILLITHWGDPHLPGSFLPATRFFINGRSWPHTERLEYAQGDTVRWRVLNMSGREHPMHLHGFHFQVEARGDQAGDRVIPREERRLVVTETLLPTETMRIAWVAEEPGNWIFHCHFMRHMSWMQTAPVDAGPVASHHHPAGGESRGVDLMGGLVLGITVHPRAGALSATEVARRRLALHIGVRPGVFDGGEPGYGFVLQEGGRVPPPDSVRFPGSPLVLTRGEPTEIVVHNRADVALGVHWHGIELESWADGVPGWSGAPGATVPAIAPGDSLAVRMTPPRAGTFMYHVHSEPGHQLAQGLYGPLLVLEPGRRWDPETERIILLGSLGAGDDPPPVVNGEAEPGPMELEAGTTYRFRFMHISPDDDKRVQLLSGETPVQWQPIAKDGADLPPGHVRSVPAELRIHVGETYDFLWTPQAPGRFTLKIVTTFDRGAPVFPRDAPPPHTVEIPVWVR